MNVTKPEEILAQSLAAHGSSAADMEIAGDMPHTAQTHIARHLT